MLSFTSSSFPPPLLASEGSGTDGNCLRNVMFYWMERSGSSVSMLGVISYNIQKYHYRQ